MYPTDASYPFDVEPAAVVFRRLLLRAAVAAGVGVALLAWGIVNVAALLSTFLLGVVAAEAHGRIVGGRAPGLSGLVLAGEMALSVLATLAVIAMAEVAGLLLAAACLGLSQRVRARLRRWMERAHHDGAAANRRGVASC